MKKMFRKLGKSIAGTNEILHELRELRLDVGRIANKLNGTSDNNHEFRVFSQWGEDGIIQWLIHSIDISSERFVEFGVEDYSESNTRFLLMNNNWSGLVMDGSQKNIERIKSDEIYWRYNIKAKQAFITAENIDDLLREEFGTSSKIGLLSVDIDGNDYWVWKAIKCLIPDIVVCEYNHRFGMERAVTIPYDPSFIREKAHYSMIYWGASIAAMNHLAEEKGYSLVAGNSNGNNVFFVKNELLNEKVTKKSIHEVYRQGQFREARDKDGNLAYLDHSQEQLILMELPLIDVRKAAK